jgi:hypothetical protein
MVEMVAFLSWLGLACWGVCFWWMHRISSRRDSMLKELHQVTKRIERVSEAEHDLIRVFHPQASKIKERVDIVARAVGRDPSGNPDSGPG